jgi:predicted HTH transcriptional regulator
MIFNDREILELKELVNDTFEKEVVSFLNSFDGKIIVGINDSGIVIGLKESCDEVMKKISERLITGIHPNPISYINIHKEEYDGISVIEIDVKKGNYNLYSISKYGFSPRGCYVRFGTTCRMMDQSEIERRFNLDYLKTTKLIDVECRHQDLTFRTLKIYFESKGLHLDDNTFKDNLNLLTKDGKYNKMAYLLSDKNDISIKVVLFGGIDKTVIINRNEYGGICLIDSLKKVEDYLDAINETRVEMKGDFQRTDTKLFDKAAVHEIWTNACQHNLWISGTPPAVYIFEDRLEIISYGGIPKGLSVDEFFLGKSSDVNEELSKIFIQLGVIEQTGHGIPLIVKTYSKEIYDFSPNFINVIVPFSFTRKKISKQIKESLSPEDKIIIFIKDNGEISRRDVEILLAVKDRRASSILKSLVDTKTLEKKGNGHNSKYVLVEK